MTALNPAERSAPNDPWLLPPPDELEELLG